VYVDSDVEVTRRLRAEAALLLTPGGVLSHRTALALWEETKRTGPFTSDDGDGGEPVHV